MSIQEQLHRQLIESMTANGSLRTGPWERAAATIPRHEFLKGGFFCPVPDVSPSAWYPVVENSDGWLRGCYADESLVTQIAGTIVPTDIRGEIMRPPTSSSTLPSLVLRMLEELQVDPDSRVLEIGTGTGYSTAVLCARLGEERVTSIEYDEDVAARARAALARLDIHPTLIAGDGLAGHADGAPYDRIVSTCGIHTIPAAWIEQTRPGGLILTTIGGWLGSSELARLTVHDDGTASGPFLGGRVSFMPARPHMPPTLGLLPDLTTGKERDALVGADVLDDWTSRFVVQSAAPNAQRLSLQQDGQTEDVLIDVHSGSWAALREVAGHWVVRQGGPDLLWDAVEDHLGHWRACGAPALEEFTVHLTPEGQTIRW